MKISIIATFEILENDRERFDLAVAAILSVQQFSIPGVMIALATHIVEDTATFADSFAMGRERVDFDP